MAGVPLEAWLIRSAALSAERAPYFLPVGHEPGGSHAARALVVVRLEEAVVRPADEAVPLETEVGRRRVSHRSSRNPAASARRTISRMGS